MFVGQLDKNVLEAGGQRTNIRDGDAVLLELGPQIDEIEMILDQGVNGLAKDGGAANAGNVAGEAKGASDLGSDDFDAFRPGGLHVGELLQLGRGAISDHLAVIDVGDVAAAFRFIHVMRSDEKSDALTGKLEEQIP